MNHFWAKWKHNTKQITEKRELELITLEMRQEQQKMIKAMRHDRLRRLSNAIIAWKEWIALEQQEKMIRMAHERRVLKMQQFLMQLQNKHIQSIQPVIKPKETNEESKIDDSPIQKSIPSVDTVPVAAGPIIRLTTDTLKKCQTTAKISNVKILKPTKSDQKIIEAMQNRERLRQERKAELARQKEERQKEIEVLLKLDCGV